MDPQAPRVSSVGQHHHRHDHTYASYSVEQGIELSVVANVKEVNWFLPFLDNKHWVCQAFRQCFAWLLASRPYSSDRR